MFNWTTHYFFGNFEQLCESARGYRIFQCDEFIHWATQNGVITESSTPLLRYLSRLWCVFEVATYKKMNPDGNLASALWYFFFNGSHRWNHRFFACQKVTLRVQILAISRKHCHGTAVCWWERAVEISGNSLVHRDLLDGPLQFWLQHLLTWDSGVQPVTWWWLVPNFGVRGPLLHLKRWDCAL